MFELNGQTAIVTGAAAGMAAAVARLTDIRYLLALQTQDELSEAGTVQTPSAAPASTG